MDNVQVRRRRRAWAAFIAAIALVLATIALALPGKAVATETQVLADGTYQLQARLMNAGNHYQESMADAAVVKPVEVSVSDGVCTAHLTMQPIQRKWGTIDFTGYLRYLRYWDGSTYRDVTMNSYYDVVDSYNDAGDGTASYQYPKDVEFPLVNGTAGDDTDGFVHLQVFVPVMAAINPDSGTQPVLLQLDWPAKHKASLTALKKALASAKAVSNVSGVYTADSFAALTTAVASAKKTVADSDSAFWDYDDAVDAIAQARTALVKASSASSRTPVKKANGYIKGKSAKAGGNTYQVTSNGKGAKATVALTRAANKKNVSVPATVKLNGKVYQVTAVGSKAFAKAKKARTVTVGKNVKKLGKYAFKSSKVGKLILKTKALTKTSVKTSLKSSKVKTVQVKVGSKSANKKYAKKYQMIFTKANAGKRVTVSR